MLYLNLLKEKFGFYSMLSISRYFVFADKIICSPFFFMQALNKQKI